jgi:hypothetical protein
MQNKTNVRLFVVHSNDMDKSWMRKPRCTREYRDGCRSFVDFAVRNCRCPDGKIHCPCKACRNNKRHLPDVVCEHLTGGKGIMPTYTNWYFHGDLPVRLTVPFPNSSTTSTDAGTSTEPGENMHEMLRDAFGVHNVNVENCDPHVVGQSIEENVTEEAATGDLLRYQELLKKAEKPLHAWTKHSKLSAIVNLYNLKCLGGVSNTAFSTLLDFFNELLPANGEALPRSTYEAKKYLKDMGLGYEKIPACRNNCMLFWKGNKDLESCTICGVSKWKDEINLDEDGQPISSTKKRPAKQLRWFPLIPRLQRLFMSHHTAPHMRWHAEGRTKDGVLRHPADGQAWKSFDNLHPEFAADSRNVRLGLCSDGFNPFGKMSTSHSTWPVMIVPYNLPPWMCMKQTSFILSLIISGPTAPGMDIDVYLQPLIEELQQLWNVGVHTFDASTKTNFVMRAQLMWTINDFPAYADLSGWPNRGEKACPCCMYSTRSKWLKHGGKFCYMGHRQYLPMDHLFRRNKRTFDGNQELGCAPDVPSGDEILKDLEGMPFGDECAGKARIDREKSQNKRKKRNVLWKKKSIFFRLPYWKDNLLRHNLDVMHIEKNVMDNILHTIMDNNDKTKDNFKARLDLQEMGLRPTLHPWTGEDGRTYIRPACHTMSKDDKVHFLRVLSNVKVPDGYASNISRCVNLNERTIIGLKSHDSHVLMQQLLPVAVRGSLPPNVVQPLVEMSAFFTGICSTILTEEYMDQLQAGICVTLCKMEQIFPPSFFTIMVHLVVHLVLECRLGGPVPYRWMYSGERYNLFMFVD